jgi:hypothetical protein
MRYAGEIRVAEKNARPKTAEPSKALCCQIVLGVLRVYLDIYRITVPFSGHVGQYGRRTRSRHRVRSFVQLGTSKERSQTAGITYVSSEQLVQEAEINPRGTPGHPVLFSHRARRVVEALNDVAARTRRCISGACHVNLYGCVGVSQPRCSGAVAGVPCVKRIAR